MSFATRLAWRAVSLVVVVAIWEVAGREAASLLFPTASATGAAFAHLITQRTFWSALWISNAALLIALPIAGVAGVLIGMALGRWTRVAQWFQIHLDVMLVTPKTALMPLIIMALGFGLTARVVVIVSFALPIIAATTKAGLEALDRRLVDMARAFGAGERQVWRHILLPGSVPAIMTAVRLGLARAVAGMISVELLLVAVGVGRLILDFRADFDAASVYAMVLVVALEAVCLTRLARALETRAGSWRGASVLA